MKDKIELGIWVRLFKPVMPIRVKEPFGPFLNSHTEPKAESLRRKNMEPVLLQILRWLMQPKVFRIVCFVSSLVGLICYALSSSFNHLFGKWTLLKIILYSIFSFIICLAILFAKAWQRSPNLQLKAHLAFLVLIIATAYSFFFDKVVTGKPDAYSLISCAAFAIMSVSLSRQTHCGIEVDLLYFFCGCLIAQLMKIKLLLVFVGAGFSYPLIIVRSYLNSPTESSYHGHGLGLGAQAQDQQSVVIRVHLDPEETNTGSTLTFAETGDLERQDQLVVTFNQVDSHSQQGNIDIDIDRDLILPQLMTCIKDLRKENRKLIRMVSKLIDLADKDQILESDHNLVMDALPPGIINELHEAVKLMVGAGFEEECCDVYSNCRREFVEECLSRFGLRELNIEEIEETGEIERWIRASNFALRVLFPNEKKLCDRIFFGFSAAAGVSFMQVCRELTVGLLNFANTCFATGKRSPSLLRGIQTLSDLIPEFESLFSDPYSVSLRNDALSVQKTLAISMEFDNLVYRPRIMV